MREDGDEKDREVANARPHWYEYRTALVGEVGSVLTRTLSSFAIGVLVAATITIITATAVEDRSVSGVLASNGIPDSAIDAITEATDQLARMSFGVLLVLGFIAPGLVALGHCLRDIAVSRAVRQAAASGAPRSSVPTPEQVAGITQQKFNQLWWYLYFGLPFPAFIMILLILTVSAEAPVLSLVCAVFLIAVGLGYRRLHTSVEPQHQRRKLRIGEHWTADDEQAVWDLADKSGAADGQRSAGRGTPPWTRNRRVILGRRLTYAAIALGCFGCEAMYMLLILLYPQANRYTNESGPRADYPPEIEHIIGVTLTVLIIVFALVLVVAIVGILLEAAGRASERASLQAIIDDATAARPPRTALVEYGFRQPARLAQGLAIISALAIVFGTATIILGAVEIPDFSGAVATFAPFRLPAVSVVVAGAVLFVIACLINAVKSIRGRQLRNRITARWPTAPTRTKDFRGHEVPALQGPALSKTVRSR